MWNLLLNSKDYIYFAKFRHGYFTNFWIKITLKNIITRQIVIQWLPDNTKMRRYVALSRIVKAAHKYFFLRRFDSTKNPSKSLGKEVVSNLAGLSSYVESYWSCIPFNSELIRWKCESNFVSEIINIAKLPLMLFESISNLFWVQFMSIYLFIFNLFIVDKFYFILQSD